MVSAVGASGVLLGWEEGTVGGGFGRPTVAQLPLGGSALADVLPPDTLSVGFLLAATTEGPMALATGATPGQWSASLFTGDGFEPPVYLTAALAGGESSYALQPCAGVGAVFVELVRRDDGFLGARVLKFGVGHVEASPVHYPTDGAYGRLPLPPGSPVVPRVPSCVSSSSMTTLVIAPAFDPLRPLVVTQFRGGVDVLSVAVGPPAFEAVVADQGDSAVAFTLTQGDSSEIDAYRVRDGSGLLLGTSRAHGGAFIGAVVRPQGVTVLVADSGISVAELSSDSLSPLVLASDLTCRGAALPIASGDRVNLYTSCTFGVVGAAITEISLCGDP